MIWNEDLSQRRRDAEQANEEGLEKDLRMRI
jgi:hypothetical protein